MAKEVRVPGENHSADNLDDKIDITLEQNNLYRVHYTMKGNQTDNVKWR